MKIIHLAPYASPYPGSFIPMLTAVRDGAIERGWSFEAIFPTSAAARPWLASMRADGTTIRIAPDVGQRAFATWLAAVVDEADRPTVLHTHFTGFDMPAAVVARRRPGVRVVWHLHTRLESGLLVTGRNAIRFGLVGRHVDAILCVSADLRDAARRRLAPADRLVLFTNAIDLQQFRRAQPDERARARSQLDAPVGGPLLVHFGWDWERKGGDLFLEAVAALSRDGLDVAALCVGGGEPARRTCARLGLEGRVLVADPREDVQTFYAAADIFISSSRAEGMPFAVLEALASGTPVVASAIPSHEPLAETATGCVIAELTPQAFADAIRSVLSARAAGEFPVSVGALASTLDLNSWAERLLDLYADITVGGTPHLTAAS